MLHQQQAGCLISVYKKAKKLYAMELCLVSSTPFVSLQDGMVCLFEGS